MPLFARLKTWTDEENLSDEDLNDEIDNILDHLAPAYIEDYSSTVGEMQTQTTPGAVGTESQATTLAGEIERLRFVIARITGETYWYTAPDASIATLYAFLQQSNQIALSRIVSGMPRSSSNQPAFLVPPGSGLTITLDATPTPLVAFIDGTQYTISADVTLGSLSVAPTSNHTCAVNVSGLAGGDASKLLGEGDSEIIVDAMGSEITALVGKWAAFKTGTEYFLAFVKSTTRLSKCRRGFFYNSSIAPLARVALTDNDTITLMKLSWLFLKTDGTLAVTYNNPRTSFDQPSGSAVGDYWFDLANQTWKVFNGGSYVSAGAVFLGMTCQDGTDIKGARSSEFFALYDDLNTMGLERFSVSVMRSNRPGQRVSVAGNVWQFAHDQARWDMAADLDTGLVEANVTYYFYVKDTGDVVISDVAPYDRTEDLKGWYHPHNPWRCIGENLNSGGDLTESNIIDFGSLKNSNVFEGDKQGVDLSDGPHSNTTPILMGTLYFNSDGRAVELYLEGTVSGGAVVLANSAADVGTLNMTIERDGSPLHTWQVEYDFNSSAAGASFSMPACAFRFIDYPTQKGRVVYKIYAATANANQSCTVTGVAFKARKA